MSNKRSRVLAASALGALLLVGQQAVVHGAQQQQTEKAGQQQAGAGQAAQAVSLAVLSPKVGDTTRYRSTLKLDFSGNEITVEQNRKHVVKEVKSNKDVVLVIEEEGGKAITGGGENPIPAGSPTTVTLNKANAILSHKPERDDNPYLSASTQHLLAFVDWIIFPDKPVKPGDTWTTEVDNPQVKGKKVTIKTTYLGEDKAEGGVAVWKIKQTVEADTEVADRKMTAETTALLDAATGQLIQAEQSVKGVPGSQGPVDWKGTLTRVKAEDKPEADKAKAKPAAS